VLSITGYPRRGAAMASDWLLHALGISAGVLLLIGMCLMGYYG